MKLTRTIAIAVIAGAATWGIQGLSVQAKTLREAEIPAEFPPASFKGKQYVDSRGCIYVRAGINGVTNWVPRVSHGRKALCGYQPTFAKAGTAPTAAAPAPTAPAPTAPANAPVITPAPKPAAATAPAPASKVKPAEPAKIAPKPAPRKVAQAAPKPKPKPAHKRRAVAAAAKPAPKPVAVAPKPRRVATAAPYVSVRRSPVQLRKRVVVPKAQKVQALAAGQQVRVVPRHVWEQQQAARLNAPIPEGYRRVWKDDRLNPKRAHQTVEGIAATDLRWTRTVPRKLYKRSTGEVVTQLYPGLIYPYYSYGEMQAAGYTVPDTGVLKQPTRRTVRLARKKRAALVSTRSVAATPAAPVKVKRKVQAKAHTSGKGRYVQVGTFGVDSNARKTAARIAALGLPARLGTLTRGGKSYRIVLAGPFAPDQVGAALSKARRAGFHDAFLR